MIRNFEYLTVFTSAPDVLPEQNDRYRIQPWKVNKIKAYKKVIFKKILGKFLKTTLKIWKRVKEIWKKFEYRGIVETFKNVFKKFWVNYNYSLE